jgi:hypothetical protein
MTLPFRFSDIDTIRVETEDGRKFLFQGDGLKTFRKIAIPKRKKEVPPPRPRPTVQVIDRDFDDEEEISEEEEESPQRRRGTDPPAIAIPGGYRAMGMEYRPTRGATVDVNGIMSSARNIFDK